ncbi:hypothetical protein ABIC02_007562 [Bradyrhizobium sp. RT5a]
MNVRYRVELSQTERAELTALLSGGKHAARKLKRAQVLLAADAGASDDAIATSVGVSGSTIYRTKRRFVLGDLEAALSEEPRPGKRCWLRRPARARRQAAPAGPWSSWRVNWSGLPSTIPSPERPRVSAWPRTSSSPGARTCGAFRRSTASSWPAWRMCSTFMPKNPIRSARWSALTRARPNSSAKCAGRSRPERASSSATICEYKRNGTVNLFIFLDVHRPWRKVKVTDSRAAVDFAACMRELADVHFPKAERTLVVLDNLSSHTAGALYQAFPPAEARRHGA